MKVLAVLLVAGGLLAGCGSKDRTIDVTRDGFIADGKVWPLSVNSGKVGCTPNPRDPDAEARWFIGPDGTKYGLNGFATVADGYADLTPIWLPDDVINQQVREAFPDEPVRVVTRLSIGGLSDLAATTC